MFSIKLKMMKKVVKTTLVLAMIVGVSSCGRDIAKEVADEYCACADADDARQCVLDWAEKHKDLKLKKDEEKKLKEYTEECREKVEAKFE